MADEPKTPRPPRVKHARISDDSVLAAIELYLSTSVPDKHRLATRRALLGQLGRATAVKVKCLQCCGYQREEIKLCTVRTCALHPVRPYQDKPDNSNTTPDEDNFDE